MIKEQKTLMRRRRNAIIISAVTVLILAIALVVVNVMVKTYPFDDVDGTRYYIKYKDKAYAMYDGDGNLVYVESEFGYYQTAAGTLVDLDAETGEYEIVAVVDTVGDENVGFNSRVLMFEHMEKKDILSIKVVNESGEYTFVRYNPDTDKIDASGNFVIKEAPFAGYNQELFASLHVSAGYTITTRKIQDPIKDADGNFSEYGLVPERRVREVLDEDGKIVTDPETDEPIMEEFDYVPAYYILTDISGRSRKVLVGDRLVTGGGYYVQCSEDWDTDVMRDAVYVLSADIANTLLAPIEDYVTPTITYPMTMNTYFDVEDFMILQKNADPEAKDAYEKKVAFSYIDLTLRENTMQSAIPYVFVGSELESYIPNSNNINTCLNYLYQTDCVAVKRLAPSNDELVEYGFGHYVEDKDGKKSFEFEPEYIIAFYYDILDENNQKAETIQQVVMVSKPNEDGNYYAYGIVRDGDRKSPETLYHHDMIVEVYGYALDFLQWESFKWINDQYINLNIAYCDSIKLETPDYWAEFILDNTGTDQSGGTSSTNLTVNGKDSAGNDVQTFSTLTVLDKKNVVWTITPTAVTAANLAGEELEISTDYYAYNVLKAQVKVLDGYIDCADGRQVKVTADAVIVTEKDGSTTTYVRFATNLFRKYFQTFLYANIEDVYEMSAEEEETLTAEGSPAWQMTLTVKDTEGKENVYSFYYLTSRKSYITINGNGGFYVMTNRVNKFVSDAQRFFANEPIDATAKK